MYPVGHETDVTTRPVANNGTGFNILECAQEFTKIALQFKLLHNTWVISERRKLLEHHACIGKITHDARDVAAMTSRCIDHNLTFNTDDFSRFGGNTILDPRKPRLIKVGVIE